MGCDMSDQLAERVEQLRALHRPRPIVAWHEDIGPALWWAFPIAEAPYCGSPLDEDFPDYLTHWTPLPSPGWVMEEPRRVQLSRARGWRMPDNTMSVARPTRWGNPFTVKAAEEAGYGTGAQYTVVAAFKHWMLGEPHWAHGGILPAVPDIEPLRGMNLACWCRLDQPCHADVLLKLANRPKP
jgi:hypothetical protein